MRALEAGGVTGIVHVTGGGLIENPPRVFSDDLSLWFDCAAARYPYFHMASSGWRR